jgi:hypothetical protein
MGCQFRLARSGNPRQVSKSHEAAVLRFSMLMNRWQVGTAIYILGLISYQGALTCKSVHSLLPQAELSTVWTAAFPGLARDLPEVKASEEKLERREIELVPS